MKKNFFKKLSFVMALAMTVSVVAPAASAFAATAPKLSATTKYLYVNETGKASEYDFGIKNLVKGSKVAFVSDNEEVATVDKATGLTTAVSRGTAHVSAKITLATKKTVTLKATVYVRDYVKSVDITAPATKYVVGTEYDFNRTFVNNGGSATTSSICRWSVDKTTATVDAATGKITFTEAGTFKVTVDAFNSAADYESYKTSKDATLVKATKTLEVSVVPTLAVAQKDLDTLTLSFNAPMTDVAKNLSIYTVVGTTEVLVTTAKPVSMSADKKTATVDFYVPLTEKATYVVKYTGIDPINFVAASSEIDKVSKVTVKTTEAVVGVATLVETQLWDANGVDITKSALTDRVTLTKTSDKVYLGGDKKLVIFTKGDTTTVDAVFHTYKYEGGKEVGTVSGSGTIVGVDAYATVAGTIKAWTLVSGGSVDFKDVKQTLSVNDPKHLYVQLSTNTNGTEGTVSNASAMTDFAFTSSDNSIVYVDSLGNLWPQKAGSVSIVVKYKDKAVDVINLTVGAEKKASAIILDKNDVTVSNTGNFADTILLGVKVKDQYNNDITLANGDVTIETLGGAANVTHAAYVATVSGTGIKVVGVSGSALSKGAYYYKVTYKNTTISTGLTVTVTEPAATTASSYDLQLSALEIDNKSTSDNLQPTLTIDLFGLRDGVRVTHPVISGGADGLYVVVTDPDGNKTTLPDTGATATFALTTGAGTAGDPIVPKKTGTYTVTAYNNLNVAVSQKFVSVKNTQAAASLTTVTTSYGTLTLPNDIAKACFDVYFNEVKQDETNLIMGDTLGTVGDSYYVKNVKWAQQLITGNANSYVQQTLTFNSTLTK